MVVPARVVPGRPADEPDVYVLIAVDRGVSAGCPRRRQPGRATDPGGSPGSRRVQLVRAGRDTGRVAREMVIAVTPLLAAGRSDPGPAEAAGHPEAAGPGSSHGWHGGQRRRGQNRGAVAHTAGPSRIQACQRRAHAVRSRQHGCRSWMFQRTVRGSTTPRASGSVPPRAARRSPCNGPRPASAVKQTRSRG